MEASIGGVTYPTRLLIELNKNKITTGEEEFNSKKYDLNHQLEAGGFVLAAICTSLRTA